MSKLIITRGLPGAGKTTRARAWVAGDPTKRARVNRDNFREMLHDGVFLGYDETERAVIAARDGAIKALLSRGIDVVNDDTNLPQKVARDLARLAKLAGADFEVWDMTDVSVGTCQVNNTKRPNPVPSGVIVEKHERYLAGRVYPLPLPEEDETAVGLPYALDYSLPPAYIIDIDGTVALRGTRSPFDESRVHEDESNRPVIHTLHALIEEGYMPIFVSGRTTACWDATVAWLKHHVLLESDWPNSYELYMRAEGDRRNDSIVKLELFDKHIRGKWNVIGVFDDRQRVVDAWRSIGLTVFQVAPGDF